MSSPSRHIPLEDSKATVYRVLGPPGCGKTSFSIRQAERAAEKYGPAAVRVVSMTRTAALAYAKAAMKAQLQGRQSIPKENVTTLHALAYLSIGKPGTLDKGDIAAWNLGHPGWELSSSQDGIDGPVVRTFGDQLRMDCELARSKMTPVTYSEAARFVDAYEEFKRERGRVDFTGMLELALENSYHAPGNPDVLFVDEAQDLSTLELALVEKWAERCKTVVLVGDSDQSLYGWRGADQRVLIREDAPPFHTLGQSYRVPRLVQEFAHGIITRSSTWSKATYLPKREDPDDPNSPVLDGEIDKINATFSTPTVIVEDLKEWVVDNPLVEDGMVLAQCGYMLDPIIRVLRQHSIGYHNPYRGEWNPLARGTSTVVTASDKVLAFARLATGRDWRIALKCLLGEHKGGPIRHGAKLLLETIGDDATMAAITKMIPQVLQEGADEMFEHGGSGKNASPAAMKAFYEASTKAAQTSMDYAFRVYCRGGREAVERPKVIVGTVHSVKGGEAEHVYLSTELSPTARVQSSNSGWDGWDSVLRTFYVGATRAKHRLVICGTDSSKEVKLC